MFRSLRYQTRSWSVVWRGRLFIHWLKDHLGFVAMLSLPIITLGPLVTFAYVEHTRIEVARQRNVDLKCLAENIYFEARGEPLAGQHAVAEVTLNRVASPQFPDTVCEVVHEARWDRLRKRRVAAFSWTELPIARTPTGAAWRQAIGAATSVYDETHTPVVSGALFYHATSIEPHWAKAKRPVTTIGNHIFYR